MKVKVSTAEGETLNWMVTYALHGDAAMRCYVVSKLGEEVEVPDDLA